MRRFSSRSSLLAVDVRALAVLLAAASLSAGLPACGRASSSSSASSTTATTSTAATASTATTTATTSTAQGTPTVSTGPVRGTLRGENHAPRVNQNWRYSVAVTDAAGHPLSGTVDIGFAFAGQVVGHDTPPTHPIVNGRWQDSLKFPAAAVGEPLTLHAVVHTSLGSITLDWPITVQQ